MEAKSGNQNSNNAQYSRRSSDSVAETRSRVDRVPPRRRQTSAGNPEHRSVVDSFNASMNVADSLLSRSPVSESPFHASWSVGDGSFLGDEYFGSRTRGLQRKGLHRGGSNSMSVRDISQIAGDDPSMIHDEARIANWGSVRVLCRTHPEYAGFAGQDGWMALHHACNRRCPHADVVEALIKAYPDGILQVESQGGRTPLHLACRFKAPKDVVRLLLHMYPARAQAVVTKHDKKGRSALFYAVRYDAPPGVVEMLLEAGPSAVLDEDRTAESPLAIVWDAWAEKHEGKRALYPFLHPEELSVAEADRAHFLQETMSADASLSKRWGMVNLFLRAAFGFPLTDAATQEPNVNGDEIKRKWRVLHATAAIKCHPYLFLVSKALYPEQALELDENELHGSRDGLDANGQMHQTALHLAAASAATGEVGRAVINVLLSLYPEAAQISDGVDGSLPLHRIVENERKTHWVFDGVRELYNSFPMACQIPDHLGRLPLHRAAGIAHNDSSIKTTPVEVGSVICNLLQAFPEAAAVADGTGCLPMHVVAEHGEIWDEQAEALLQANPVAVRVRAGRHLDSRLPIHLAAASPDAKHSLIARLVELHPMGVRQTDRTGKLPLHLACESGKAWENGVGAIHNADTNAIAQPEGNPRGWLALHMAASSPNAGADLIDKLTEYYPEAAREADAHGRYPLHWACFSGKSWDGGLKSIFEANPAAILVADETGLLPFQVAAIHYCFSSEDEEGSLSDFGEKPSQEVISSIPEVDSNSLEDVSTGEGDIEVAKVEMLFQLLRTEPSILAFMSSAS